MWLHAAKTGSKRKYNNNNNTASTQSENYFEKRCAQLANKTQKTKFKMHEISRWLHPLFRKLTKWSIWSAVQLTVFYFDRNNFDPFLQFINKIEFPFLKITSEIEIDPTTILKQRMQLISSPRETIWNNFFSIPSSIHSSILQIINRKKAEKNLNCI